MTLELTTDERHRRATAAEQRAAAIRVADHIAAEHPSDIDDLFPRHAGRQLAHDPAIAAGVLELLAALDIRPELIRRNPRA